MQTSFININESALRHNYQRVRQLAPQSKIVAMLKANAYGHGLIECARVLTDADALGVACLSEAVRLREANIFNRIVVMRGVKNSEELAIAQKHNVELVVHHPSQLELLKQQQNQGPFRLWLKINTGMNRLGFPLEDALTIYEQLLQLPLATRLCVFTHFACAGEIDNLANAEQIQRFQEITAVMDAEKSLANSAAILKYPESHADWVRAGLMLYGVSPFPGTTGENFNLRPVMTWQASLVSVRSQKAGDAVGYGFTWHYAKEGLLGIVGVGYGDGYPRHAQNGTPLKIRDKIVPLIGRVSMDMLAVDLTTVPDAQVDDTVILWGDGLPVETIAPHTASSAYELLCHVKCR